MDRFHEMQVFLAVAEEAGFAAAARRLKTSPPSVTRAIAAMEQRIGTQLLARLEISRLCLQVAVRPFKHFRSSSRVVVVSATSPSAVALACNFLLSSRFNLHIRLRLAKLCVQALHQHLVCLLRVQLFLLQRGALCDEFFNNFSSIFTTPDVWKS